MAAYDSRNLHLIELVDGRLTVYLQPGFCNKVADGVREELNNSLLRYLDDHEAVLLGYKNIRVLTKQALLTPWLPYLTIEAQAELLWLRPVPGKILVGRVHKLNEGVLSLVVLGGINASIPAEQMPDGFAFDTQNHCCVPDADHSRAIMMGDFVACRVLTTPVTDPEENQLLFSLDATLRDPEAGLCAMQTALQNRKRSHLAATVAGQKTVQPTDQDPMETGQEPTDKHQHKKQRQKERKLHTQENEKHSSSRKEKKRNREEGKEQHKAKKRRAAAGNNQQTPQHHQQPQQGQQQPLPDSVPDAAAPAGAADPETPAPLSSRKDRQRKNKHSSLQSSSSEKRHRRGRSSKHKHTSNTMHQDSSQGKQTAGQLDKSRPGQ